VVLALAEAETGPMMSRLPAFLHPVAGRPLIWHTVTSLLTAEQPVREVLVLTPPDFPPEVLGDLGPQVEARTFDPGIPNRGITGHGDEPVLLAHAGAAIDRESLRRLVGAGLGAWVGGTESDAAATIVRTEQLLDLLQKEEPFRVPNGILSPLRRIESGEGSYVVRNRHDLAKLQGRVRDQLIRALMDGGATFLLPESVLVDVDVRIGRDTVVYPGVILEGSTNVGAETVIGPGCRIIDSWIGSGVELRGYNYIAHASVRNRAILEPYVRRGFD
jgi:hypothetical protein